MKKRIKKFIGWAILASLTSSLVIIPAAIEHNWKLGLLIIGIAVAVSWLGVIAIYLIVCHDE